MPEPQPLVATLRGPYCASCLGPAVVLLTSPGRAVQVCTRCEPSAQRWAAQTGPVTRTEIRTINPEFIVQQTPLIVDEGTLF